MRGNRVVVTIAILLLLVLLYAWFDGGQEPLSMVEQPIDVPESVQ